MARRYWNIRGDFVGLDLFLSRGEMEYLTFNYLTIKVIASSICMKTFSQLPAMA